MGARLELWYRRTLSGLFIAGITLPLLQFVFGTTETLSHAEQRVLARAPSPPRDLESWTRLPRELTAYFDDHFGYRDVLIRVHGSFLDVLDARGTGLPVLEGREDWLYYTGDRSIEDFRGQIRLGSGDLANWRAALAAREDWLRKQGIGYLFVLAPNKQTIYPEYLPEWLPAGGETVADQLAGDLQDLSEGVLLDLRAPLRRATAGPRLFHKLDTHWNAWGANLAQDAIMQRLSRVLPGIEPALFAEADIRWREKRGGDLARMAGAGDRLEAVPVFPRLRSLCPHARLQRRERTAAHRTLEDRCPSGAGRVLILHDSFAHQLRPFLSRRFSRSVYVHIRPNLCELKELVERYRPNVVIEQRVERFLTDTPDPACRG